MRHIGMLHSLAIVLQGYILILHFTVLAWLVRCMVRDAEVPPGLPVRKEQRVAEGVIRGMRLGYNLKPGARPCIRESISLCKLF